MADQLRIEIIGSLNVGKSIGEINTAVKGIEKKINEIKLNVKIDDKVTSTLNNFAKQMDQVAQVAKKSGKVIETALLPDGTKVKREYFNGLKNEFSEIVTESKKVKGAITDTSFSVQDQKNRIKDLTKEYTKLVKEAKRYDAAGNLKGTTSTYMNNKGNARVVNTNEMTGDVTHRDINNYQKLIDIQATLRKELMQLAQTGRYTTSELRKIGQGINFASTLTQLDKVKRQMSNMQFGTNLQSQQEKLKNSLKGLYDQAKITDAQLRGIGRNIDATKNVAEIDKIQKAMNRLAQTSDNKALQSKLLSQSSTLLNSSTKGIDKTALNSMVAQLNGIKPASSNAANALRQIENELKRIKQTSSEASAASRTLGEQLTSAAGKFGMWIGIGAAVYAPINFVKQMTQTIVELDSKLVSLQKVMDRDTNFDAVMRSAAGSAGEFAKTISETMDTYIEFSRQGYKQDEIPLLADAALITSNVGEMSAAQAAEYLTSTLVQMKLEAKDAMDVIDSWNNISNKNATTIEKLAQGYSRAASVASTWGMDMNELNAIIGTVTAATKQSGNEIGNFVKNVLPRLTSKPAEKALNMTGVSLTDETGKLKSALQIYKEISVEYNKMSQLDQSIVAEGLAGKQHISRMSALLQNMDMVEKIYNDSVDSANSARIENEKYMHSLEARIQKVKLSVEQLYLGLGEAFFTESFVELLEVLKNIASAATWTTKTFGGLPVILGGVGAAAIVMSKGFRSAVVDMSVFRAGLKGLNISLASVSVAFKGLLASAGVGLVFAGIGFAIEKLLSVSGKARQEMEEYQSRNKELMLSFQENKDSLLKLTEAYSKYDSIIKSGDYDTNQLQEYNRITKELAGAMPSLVIGEDQYGNKILASSEYVEAKTKMLERQLAIQEKLDAKKESEQAQSDYDTASNVLEDAKKKKKEFLDSLNDDLLDIAVSNSFGIVKEKDVYLKSIDEIESRIEALQAKQESEGLSRTESKTLQSLKDASEEYDRLSLSVEDAKVAMQSSSVAMINSSMALDDSISASSKSMIQDFAMFVATSGSSAKAIDDTLSKLGDKLSSNQGFKETLQSYSEAIDTYKEKISQGLGEDKLTEFKEKAISSYNELRNSILKVAEDSGISGQKYNTLAAQLDNSANSALSLDTSIDSLAKSTGKSKEELLAALALTPDVAAEMDTLGTSVDDTSAAYDNQTESLNSAADAQKNLQDVYKNSISSIQSLNGIMQDLNENHTLSADNIGVLMEKYPELLAYIGDEKTLRIKLQEQIDNEAKVAKNAMLEKLSTSETFYNAALNGNKDYVQKLNTMYGIDLKSYKNLASAKIAVDNVMRKRLTDAWNAFVSSTGRALSTSVNGKAPLAVDLGVSGGMDKYNDNPLYKDYLKAKDVATDFNDIFVKQIDLTSDAAIKSAGLSKETNKNSSANKSAAKSAKSAADEYKNYTYVTDKFKNAIRDVNLELQKQENITKKYSNWSDAYRNSLKKEINALKEKKKLLTDQASSLNKQIRNGKIKDTGVVEVTNSSPSSSNNKLSGWGGKQTSQYGWRTDPVTGKKAYHRGIDIAGKSGSKLDANVSGKVIAAGTYGKGSGYNKYGNVVVIKDDKGLEHVYAHLSKVLVKVGQQVEKGQQVGKIGSTGKSTGAHLHYEVRKNGFGTDIDPTSYYKQAKGKSSGGKANLASVSSSVSGRYSAPINKYAKQYGVDPYLIKAVAMQESALGKASKNVMQVKGMNGKSPEASIKKGTQMISNLLKKTGGDVNKALAAYNMGEGILSYFDKHGGYSVKNMKNFSALQKKKHGYKVYGDPNYVANVAKHYGKDTGTNAGANKSNSSIYPTLKLGAKGDAVKELQKLLGIGQDGIFGKKTLSALKAYQKKNGLTADGVVGKKTWNKLTGGKATDYSSKKSKQNAENKKAVDDAKSEVKDIEGEISDVDQRIADLYFELVNSKIRQYEMQVDSADSKIKSKELDAQKIQDQASSSYRKNLADQVKLHGDKKKALSQEVRYIENQIKNNKNLTKAQKDELKTTLADKKNALKEIDLTVKEINKNIAQSSLDEIINNYEKKLTALDKKFNQSDQNQKSYRRDPEDMTLVKQLAEDDLNKQIAASEKKQADLEKKLKDKKLSKKDRDKYNKELKAEVENEKKLRSSLASLDKKYWAEEKKKVAAIKDKINATKAEAAALQAKLKLDNLDAETRKNVQAEYDKAIQTINDYTNELQDMADAEEQIIADNLTKQKEINLEAIRKKYEDINKELDELVSKDDAFNTGEFFNSIAEIINELDVLDEKFINNPIGVTTTENIRRIIDDTKNGILSLNSEMDKLIANTSENEKELEKIIRDEITRSNELGKTISAVDDVIRNTKLQHKQIEDSLQNQIDLKQKQLDQLDEQYEAEDRIKALQEINDEIAKTKNDKRFSYIGADGKEILTYDKGKLDDLTKQRDEMVEQYQRDDVKKAMQDEIDRLQDQLSKTQAIHQAEISQWELYRESLVTLQQKLNDDIAEKRDKLREIQDKVVEDTEKQWDDLITAVENGTMTYTELMKTWYKGTIEDMKKGNAEVNAQLAEMKQAYDALVALKAAADAVETSTPHGTRYTLTKGNSTKTVYSKNESDALVKQGYKLTKTEKFHEGGIVGAKPNKLGDMWNSVFNTKPNEQVITSLKGELQVPPKNFENGFNNIRRAASSLVENHMTGIPVGDHIILQNVTIKADNPQQFLKDLDTIVRMNKK